MRSLSLLLLLLARLQEPQQLPKEPVQDWKYQLKDLRKDPKTGNDIEEVTLILEGKEAIPRSLARGKEIFDVRGVDARYFTTPGKSDEKSREIKVKADRGTIDKGARTLKLDDNVRVVRKGDAATQEVDTILLTPSALLRFNTMYECPQDRRIFGALGHCPDHGLPLRETTITSVETDREFLVTGPEGILSGEGLVTDDAIRKEYHIARKGFVEFGGDVSSSGVKKTGEAPQTRFTQIYSIGPLHISGPEDQRVVQGEGGVRVDQIDHTGTMTMQSRTLHIDTIRRWDLSPSGPVEARTVDARGDVVIDGSSFSDGDSFHATSDTLLRTYAPDEDPKKHVDRTDLRATAPRLVQMTRGGSRIDSRSVITDRAEDGSGVSTFEEVVRSDLVAGTQHFSLAGGHLVLRAEPDAAGKTDVRSLDATDRVVLGGLMPAAKAESPDGPSDPGEAYADHFAWDVKANRGLLEARPFVHIIQGASLIVAPLVLLESPNIMVLKGPKQVRLTQVREGKPEEYRATCDGDLILDNASRHLTMRNNCRLQIKEGMSSEDPLTPQGPLKSPDVSRSQDMILTSDRVNAVLAPEGKGMESLLALGRVHAIREFDQTNLYGDRLAYRFTDQDLRVYGGPTAVADTGHTIATQEQIRVYQKPHPKTGLPVRYTEMIGGSDGVRIEIEERANPKADEKKK
jgi:hypothetical protein